MENTHGVFFMLVLLGCLQSLTATGNSDYHTSQLRGDIDDSPSQAVGATGLGFSGIEQRHDGYVKGETPTIPKTSFTCSAQPFNPGLYADMETQCQVYHVCFGDRQESFLCGPGTNFNQKILACDFWYNFDCQDSPSFYTANADIGKIPEPYRPTGEQSISVSRDRTKITQQPVYPDFPRDEQKPITTDDNFRPKPPVQPPRVSVIPQPPRSPAPVPQPPKVQTQPPRVSYPPPPRVSYPPPPKVSEPPRVQEPIRPPIVSYPPPPRVSYPPPPSVSYPPPPPRVSYPPPPPRVSYPPPPPKVSEPPRVQQPAQPPIRVQPPPPKVRPPPAIQQQVDTEYDFEDSKQPFKPSLPPPPPPSRPALPSPPPPRVVYTTPKPVFPPVVSPPRISRPPLSPPVAVLPPAQPARPRVPIRPEFPAVSDHPSSDIKGSTGYRPQDPQRVPQPSGPVDTSYPSPRPVITRPERPFSPPVQQEHVEVDYVPLPPKTPPPPPPSRPTHQERVPPPPRRPPTTIQTEYVHPPPPPSRPTHQERVPPPPRRPPTTIQTEYVPPPPPPPPPKQPPVVIQQEKYVPPPPPPQKPIRPVLPPVSPPVVSVQQRPQGPPARPSVTVSVRPQQPPPRPRPVFPPASDHPNANIKGGPGYQQPPPQPPRFEPTRIGTRPVTVPRQPPTDSSRYETSRVKTPPSQVSTGYKPPIVTDRVKQPSIPDRGYEPPRIPSVSVAIPPPKPQTPSFPPPRAQIVDHPSASIKGGSPVPQPPRIQSPTSSVGIKRPESSVGYEVKPSIPSRPVTGIKTEIKIPEDSYKPPIPQPPFVPSSGIKVPSTPGIQQIRPQFPAPRPQPIDHPNANIKGGPGYQPPRPQQPVIVPQVPQQPVRVPQVPRPVISQPPTSPTTTSQRTKTAPGIATSTGRGFQTPPRRPDYPKGDDVYPPAVQQVQEPPRKPLSPAVHPPPPVSTVKQTTGIKQPIRGPPSSTHRVSVKTKQTQPDYVTGSSYKRGSETYPKPEFQQPAYPSGPYQPPIATPSRSSDFSKKRPATQSTSHDPTSQFPAFPGVSVSQHTQTRHPSGSHPAEYPYREVPGHQPPHQRQVFPHRDNPDHPNESIKGSSAYRPPPPADFQPAASDTVEHKTATTEESKTEASKLGDTGTE